MSVWWLCKIGKNWNLVIKECFGGNKYFELWGIQDKTFDKTLSITKNLVESELNDKLKIR